MEVDCRHTAIREKRGCKRLIVYEHVSGPMPGQPLGALILN